MATIQTLSRAEAGVPVPPTKDMPRARVQAALERLSQEYEALTFEELCALARQLEVGMRILSVDGTEYRVFPVVATYGWWTPRVSVEMALVLDPNRPSETYVATWFEKDRAGRIRR